MGLKLEDSNRIADPAVGRSYRVDIPDFLPVSVNALLALHWSKRSRLKSADAAVVAAMCNHHGVPKATGKRRVSVTFRQSRGRFADEDNRKKSLLDSLVACGRLVDDSPAWCEQGGVATERGPNRTVIVLEDVR